MAVKKNSVLFYLLSISILFLVEKGWSQSTFSIDTLTQEMNPPGRTTVLTMDEVMTQAKRHFQKTKSGYKQYKRNEYYALNHLGRNGELINSSSLNFKAYTELKKTIAQDPARGLAHNGNWKFLGPSTTNSSYGQMARVNRFAFHPTDSDIIFASTAGGGLWKTYNKGIHWEPLSDGVPVMNTSGVAVDFVDPDILYVLSGDGDGAGGSSTGAFYWSNGFTRTSIGVIKSYDGGHLWRPTGLYFDEMDNVAAYNLYMSPEDRFTLYVCTDLGLLRTTDGGDHWTTIKNDLIYEMKFKPGDADRIYCVNDTFLFVSDDGGSTWMDSTYIPSADGAFGRMTMATCSANDELVYLFAAPIDTLSATDTIPDHRGIWRSTNSGADFTLISTRPNIFTSNDPVEFKENGWYDINLACNPLDENEILAGTISIWTSNDAGENWTNDNGTNSLYHADIHALAINPLDNTLYVGSDGGVSMSTDFGQSYVFRTGDLAATQYYKMATSPFFSDKVLLGAQDNGVMLRGDTAAQFDHVVFGDGMESLYHPSADSLAISSVQFGEIHISRDTGHTFTKILPPIDTGGIAEWTTPLAFDALDPNIIYVGYKPIMKSIDQGDSFFATSNDTISAHKILINNSSYPNRIYAGDCRNCGESDQTFEFYKSTDSGNSWQRIDMNPGFPDTSYVSAVALSNNDSLEIWLTCAQYEAPNKVFRSMDSGATWTNESGSLPNVPVNTIVYKDNNGNPSGAVYVGTDIGIFYRDDELEDWIYFSNNLPIVEVTDMDIDYEGGWLRAATYGRGLWQSEFYTPCEYQIVLDTSNQELGHSYVHHASGQIFSTAHVDGYGSKVVYKSEGHVVLAEGFRATSKRKAVFRALKGDCSEGGLPLAPLMIVTDSTLLAQPEMREKILKKED